MKKKVTNPNFYLGLISLLMFIIGLALRANRYHTGDYFIGAAFAIGLVHWIWGITDVMKFYRTQGSENRQIIWIILVCALPAVGSMLFYIIGPRVKM